MTQKLADLPVFSNLNYFFIGHIRDADFNMDAFKDFVNVGYFFKPNLVRTNDFINFFRKMSVPIIILVFTLLLLINIFYMLKNFSTTLLPNGRMMEKLWNLLLTISCFDIVFNCFSYFSE